MCPFRKLDTHGKIIAYAHFKGWDPAYWASKPLFVRKLMEGRMRRVKDLKIRLEGEVWSKFLAAKAELDNRKPPRA